MKRIKNVFYAIISALIFSSCIDSILDKKPLDIITEDAVWKDQTLIDAYLLNLYRGTTVLTQDGCGLVNGWGTDALSGTDDWTREFNFSPLATGPQWLNQLSDEAKTGWIYFDGVNKDVYKVKGITIDGGILEYWEAPYMHIPADTRSAFPVISVQSPVSIQYCWQS